MLGKIKITNFGKRHFEGKFSGTKITDFSVEEFETIINSCAYSLGQTPRLASFSVKEKFINLDNDSRIIDGYAPFCKILVAPNFTNARIGSMPIDMSNYQYLRHGYSARTEKELPVLSRWFELPIPAPVASHLIIILYSREQLKKEREAEIDKEFAAYEKRKGKTLSDSDKTAMRTIEGYGFEFDNTDVEWGIVAILGQNHSGEEPMPPITMMRNALGVEEGGSGVSLNRDKYIESVEFWSKNAIVKS